ncbi:MAG: hypothetical protein C0620_09960 [Desulfuromonas sp.]|nr:MAG: hypothetical protein C0620_09960 [Desulfuromonas sp.]
MSLNCFFCVKQFLLSGTSLWVLFLLFCVHYCVNIFISEWLKNNQRGGIVGILPFGIDFVEGVSVKFIVE